MLANQIIEKFTIQEKSAHLQLITIYMNSNQFDSFEKLVKTFNEGIEFYKITDEGCYFIKGCFTDKNLNQFLEKIELYCRYKINHQLKQII